MFTRTNACLAQLVEQWTVNPCVAGSKPAAGAKDFQRLLKVFFLCLTSFYSLVVSYFARISYERAFEELAIPINTFSAFSGIVNSPVKRCVSSFFSN